MTLFGKPFSPILLELEEKVCGRGETRPRIVDYAYHKIINGYGKYLTKSDRVVLGAMRLIFKGYAVRNVLQHEAAKKIINKGPVQRWGIKKYPDWRKLNRKHKVERLFVGISDKAREQAFNEVIARSITKKGSDKNRDYDDIDEARNRIARIFLEDIIEQNNASSVKA